MNMSVMNFRPIVPAIVVMLLITSSCTSNQSGKTVLTVSLPPQRYLLEWLVGGDDYDVQCLLASGGNPEAYEPSMSQLVALERSAIYFKAGNVGFEDELLRRVASDGGTSLDVVDTSAGMELIAGSHGDSLEIDPHTWSSVANGRIISANMLHALCDRFPEHRDRFISNHERLSARMDSVDSVLHARLDPLRGTAFMVWHPSLSYFARDYGLTQLSVGAESKEVSVGMLRGVVDEARASGVVVLFVQKNFDRRQVQTLASELGLEPVVIDPLNYEWDSELLATGTAIASAVD